MSIKDRKPIVYPALLSKVSEAFRERVIVSTKTKDNIEYSNAFDGREAVDKLAYIIKTTDRNLALLLGRSLDAQKFFHDVSYEHRLRDSSHELYQFNSTPSTTTAVGDDMPPCSPATTLHDDDFTEDLSSVNFANDAPNNNSCDVGTPNAVFTVLTDCYSSTCTRDKLCYSVSCPRRLEQARSTRRPQHGRSSSNTSLLFAEEEERLWVYTVPKPLVETMSKQEIRRQENIYELIYTERDFVNDLLYLKKYWIDPLLDEPIISDDLSDRQEFVEQVFWNVMEVYRVNSELLQALLKRQMIRPDVQQIGEVMVTYTAKFEPFVRYGAHQVIGKHIFETEKSTNSEFAKFVQKTERLKQSRKLELNGYLTKPTTRLGRYNLLLREILRHTPEDHPDQENLSKAMKIISNFLTAVNRETGKTESRHNIYLLEQRLVNHRQADMDLGLRAEDRQLVLKGALKKKGSGSESSDMLLFLLDHYLVITKQKFANNTEYYKLYRKPIPLALLSVSFPDLTKRSSSILPSYSRTSKDSFTSVGSMDSITAATPPPPSPSASTNTNSGSKSGYPLCFSHLGKHGTAPITLFAATMAIRRQWIVKIQSQQQAFMEKNKIIELVPINGDFFTAFNKVRCAAGYDGGKSLVFGSDQGVYVKRKNSFVRILAMEKVSQIDVLENGANRLLLVLADKVLYAYPLDTLLLDPELAGSGRSSSSNRRGNAGRKINSHVSFFKIGKIQRSSAAEKTLVCFVRQNAMTSTIRALEPQQHHLGRLIRGPQDSLKVYKDLYIPGVASSIQFFRNIICVGCPKGFQMVDLASTEVQSVLDPSDTRHQSILQRENLKPITMFRHDGNILLCYNEIAFYIDKKGRRVREDWMICWEGNPVSFAFRFPYIIAFDPTFVEVRHIDTVSEDGYAVME
ncbi:CNH domain-containing protein [Zychaea mexicana]|uniref:CNH domain-containing protein n=1 Tax=Zychaea mexicana TaxID=64656 RepID=UPI0022FDC97E|nr:CNH domain-containing protein [Zychaea mexicana]KAI9468052.1 CNH domain-containing protein [Zychaea mexicana]